jgi:hypothetical protein
MPDSDTKTRANSLYERDFFTWTQEQARLLRERRFGDLDLDNLVDEVESVGSSEKREVRSRLVVLIGHMLKWRFQQLNDILDNSPSLRSYASEQISRAYRGARLLASKETGIAFGVFPTECPFDEKAVLDLEFFPEDREFE